MRPLAVLLFLAACHQTQGCRSCRTAPEPTRAQLGSASAAANSGSAPAIPTALPPRRPTPPDIARRHRARLLKTILDARAAITEGRARDALRALAQVTPLDPTGGALAVEMSRAAAAAGDDRRAREWAQRALERATGNASVITAAEQELQGVDAAHRARLEGSSLGPFPSTREACAELVDQVKLGKSHALGLAQGEVSNVDCHAGVAYPVGKGKLQSVTELRLSLDEGGRTEASWVALQTNTGLLLYGPLVRVHTPARHDVVNAYMLRLGHLDALAGGEQEVSVGIDERLTQLDVALNETASVDRTQIVVLTLDRKPIAASETATTSETIVVRAIDGKDDEPPPPGYQRSEAWNTPRTHRLQVRWSDNELLLSPRTDTSLEARRIVLFP